MEKINVSRNQFKKMYFHMSANNSHFVKTMIIGNNQDYKKLQNPNNTQKLGKSSLNYDDMYRHIWFFKLDNDIYYYDLHEIEGVCLGVFMNKKITPELMFHPDEYQNHKNKILGNKLIEFCKKLNKLL